MSCSGSDATLDVLVQSHHILAAAGQADGTLGHVSLRDPLGRGFWLKRAEIGMDEVGAGDFLLVSLAGERVAGEGALHSEWPIHAELLRARPAVTAVVHTHARNAALFSATTEALQPFTTDGGYFINHPVSNFHAPRAHIDDPETARTIAAFMGEAPAVLVRNHGLIACADTVALATLVSLFLDRAAAVHLATLGVPSAFHAASTTDMMGRAAMLRSASFVEQNFAYYARTAQRTIAPDQRRGSPRP